MAKDIVMPKMGYDMTEGKLLRWIKHEGDTVTKGEAIAEIETDKVNIEVEAFDNGVLRRIVVPEGQTVPVGDRIAIMAAPDEELADEAPSAGSTAPGARGQRSEVREQPAPDDGRTDSAPSAPSDGRAVAEPSGNGHDVALARAHDGGRAKASPLARRLAQEHGVDLNAIAGTGPGGRVTRDDVLAAAGAAPSEAPAAVAATLSEPAPAPTAAPAEAPRPAPALAASGEQALTRLQQTVARRMVESKTQAPHFYLTADVDMTDALALRRQLNEQADEGVKISVNDLVIKACARALVKHPALNASFAGDRLAMHERVSIAVAVAMDEGLVTPVIGDADRKSIGQIATESKALAERARAGKSRLEDYEGGTFTVSNLGMFGVDAFVAIINPPQAAILAVGAAHRVPVYVGDELVPRDRMTVTLSVDHRVADGAAGARFLAEVRAGLENPLRLLM